MISPGRLTKALALSGAAALVLATHLFLASMSQAKPDIGKAAPEFTGAGLNGKTIKLSDLRGKTVVLEWTNHECPYVGKHYSTGNMQALQKDAAGNGVVWLTIVSSGEGQQGHLTTKQAGELTASRKASPAAVILDAKGEIGRLYDARTTPHMFIIDKDGRLVYMGGIDDKPTTSTADVKTAKNYVRAALGDLQAGKAVAEPLTRPYGCSVKYRS